MPNHLRNLILFALDAIDIEKYSGVYEIPCIKAYEPEIYYIDITTRKFKYIKNDIDIKLLLLLNITENNNAKNVLSRRNHPNKFQ